MLNARGGRGVCVDRASRRSEGREASQQLCISDSPLNRPPPSFPSSPRYLNAIQTMCPHILRYLTTAVITNKDVRKRRQVLKDLVKVIQQVKQHSPSPEAREGEGGGGCSGPG